MKPSCLDAVYKAPPQAWRAEQEVNGHVLVAPRGNPKQGPPLYWDVRCRKCKRVSPLASAGLHNLHKKEGCKFCAPTRKKQADLTSRPP